MIIHSIVPIEVIFQNMPEELTRRPVTMQYMGEMVEVVPNGNMGYTIARVLSTSPKAYLNPELQPGKEIIVGIGKHK